MLMLMLMMMLMLMLMLMMMMMLMRETLKTAKTLRKHPHPIINVQDRLYNENMMDYLKK